jgi:threonine aldolase
VPHLSPTTLTTDEQRLILRATAGNVRDHTIISLALGTGLRTDPAEIETNIVIASVDPADAVKEWLEYLRAGGVLSGTMGRGRQRFVTHLDVDDAGIDRAIDIPRQRQTRSG